MTFMFENLQVYQRAVDFAEQIPSKPGRVAGAGDDLGQIRMPDICRQLARNRRLSCLSRLVMPCSGTTDSR